MQNNEWVRAQLFENRPIRQLNPQSRLGRAAANAAREAARAEAARVEEARRRAEMEEQIAATATAMAAMQEGVSRLEVRANVSHNLSTKILKRADEILSVSRNIKSITSETLAGVKDLKRMVMSGDPAIFKKFILNEWVALITIFLLHPHLPIAVETVGPIWGYLVSAGWIQRQVKNIGEGRAVFAMEGGPIRWAYNIVASGPHAIFLIFQLTSRWNAIRVGSTLYGATETSTVFADMYESSLEAKLVSALSNLMQSFRDFQAHGSAANIPGIIARKSIEEYHSILTGISGAHAHIVSDIRAMDPDGAMFSDWGGFLNLLAGYLAGKLYYTTVSGLHVVFRAPEYLAQIGTVAESEQYLLLLITHFFYDFFGNMFKEWTTYLHTVVCGAICTWRSDALAGSSSWGISGWVAGAAAAATGVIAGILRCNCGAVGGSYKKQKTSRRKRSHRKHTRKQHGGDKEHAMFITLMWNALLFYSAPAITHGAIKLDPVAAAAVDKRGSAALTKMIAAGEYTPPFWIEGIDDVMRLPDAGLLALTS